MFLRPPRLAPGTPNTVDPSGLSVITARAGGANGTLGTSKSYREQREPLYLRGDRPYWRLREAGQI